MSSISSSPGSSSSQSQSTDTQTLIDQLRVDPQNEHHPPVKIAFQKQYNGTTGQATFEIAEYEVDAKQETIIISMKKEGWEKILAGEQSEIKGTLEEVRIPWNGVSVIKEKWLSNFLPATYRGGVRLRDEQIPSDLWPLSILKVDVVHLFPKKGEA